MRARVDGRHLTGAVGTQAALGAKGLEVQPAMMANLGLSPVDVSNQIIARDRYAEYIMFLANVATTLDKIGVEIRFLQRTEIGRGRRGLRKKPVGSSTMPHKRDPTQERAGGRTPGIVRGLVQLRRPNIRLFYV